MFSSSVSVVWVLSCFLILPSVLWASPLSDKTNKSGGSVSMDSSEAHVFLARSPRSADAKWNQKDPDFQSYYSSIGHVEGLYEIDKIWMLYQQTYGADASNYQDVAALQVPSTTTKPPPPPITHLPVPSLSQSEVLYLCNPKDPLCKSRIVYVPTGAVVVPCDPRYHPSCKFSTSTEGPSGATEPSPPDPMEYNCDPSWDPECLIEKPQRPVKASHRPASNLSNRAEKENEDVPASSAEDKEALDASYELFDYYKDRYDPNRYVNSALGPE